MPRKCVTNFDGKPCTSNYQSNKDNVSVFRFPKDPEERLLWINALPSKIVVGDYSVVCEKHWSEGYKHKKSKGPLGYRPVDPPSEFGITSDSCSQQTPSTHLRGIESRHISAESRMNKQMKKQKLMSEKQDSIPSWDDLKKYSQSLNLRCILK